MKIEYNIYYLSRIWTIEEHLKVSKPGKRGSQEIEPGVYKFWSEKSTFPSYIRFSYIKKPKYWHSLTDKEKEEDIKYYQLNTTGVLHILKKLQKQKPLTRWQSIYAEELFYNLYEFEKDYNEEFGCKYVDDCPEF